MRKPQQQQEDINKIVSNFIPLDEKSVALDIPIEGERRGRGRPKLKPENLSSEEIRVLLPVRVKKAIDRIIDGTGTSMSAYIRNIVTDHLKKSGQI
jgi:hypothetical protein